MHVEIPFNTTGMNATGRTLYPRGPVVRQLTSIIEEEAGIGDSDTSSPPPSGNSNSHSHYNDSSSQICSGEPSSTSLSGNSGSQPPSGDVCAGEHAAPMYHLDLRVGMMLLPRDYGRFNKNHDSASTDHTTTSDHNLSGQDSKFSNNTLIAGSHAVTNLAAPSGHQVQYGFDELAHTTTSFRGCFVAGPSQYSSTSTSAAASALNSNDFGGYQPTGGSSTEIGGFPSIGNDSFDFTDVSYWDNSSADDANANKYTDNTSQVNAGDRGVLDSVTASLPVCGANNSTSWNLSLDSVDDYGPNSTRHASTPCGLIEGSGSAFVQSAQPPTPAATGSLFQHPDEATAYDNPFRYIKQEEKDPSYSPENSDHEGDSDDDVPLNQLQLVRKQQRSLGGHRSKKEHLDLHRVAGGGIKKPARNKDGSLRKLRNQRPPLINWDLDTVGKGLIGVVWSCGEVGQEINFAQAAQIISPTCTASALQQAILKLAQKLKDKGHQVPRIKMSWPKKGADPKTQVYRIDAKPLPRRKPTLQQGIMCRIVVLKAPYDETKRSHLQKPWTYPPPVGYSAPSAPSRVEYVDRASSPIPQTITNINHGNTQYNLPVNGNAQYGFPISTGNAQCNFPVSNGNARYNFSINTGNAGYNFPVSHCNSRYVLPKNTNQLYDNGPYGNFTTGISFAPPQPVAPTSTLLDPIPEYDDDGFISNLFRPLANSVDNRNIYPGPVAPLNRIHPVTPSNQVRPLTPMDHVRPVTPLDQIMADPTSPPPAPRWSDNYDHKFEEPTTPTPNPWYGRRG